MHYLRTTFVGLLLHDGIFMACSFMNPRTRVGAFENFWSNVFERLCAGSVEMMSTERLRSPGGAESIWCLNPGAKSLVK